MAQLLFGHDNALKISYVYNLSLAYREIAYIRKKKLRHKIIDKKLQKDSDPRTIQ